MTLIKCPDCGKEISPDAEACPECGRPMKGTVATSKGTSKGEGLFLRIIDVFRTIDLGSAIVLILIGLIVLMIVIDLISR